MQYLNRSEFDDPVLGRSGGIPTASAATSRRGSVASNVSFGPASHARHFGGAPASSRSRSSSLQLHEGSHNMEAPPPTDSPEMPYLQSANSFGDSTFTYGFGNMPMGPPRPKRVIAKQINHGDHFGHSEILKPGPRLHT